MTETVVLPTADGAVETHRLSGTRVSAPQGGAPFPRVAYAAAHVVADPRGARAPFQDGRASGAAVDWDATLAFRARLWSMGFKIAEAMDTAQRGMGLGWADAKELIARSLADARATDGADLACGAGTDQLDPADARSLDDVVRAYAEQISFIEGEGGRTILMASRALARVARGPDEYAEVYDRILAETSRPATLHWLGPMFDPALDGYWGGGAFETQCDLVLDLISRHEAKIEGIKISLLDAEKEIALRARLPEGVLMYTGDDFNFAELIAGDGERASHALLGIFDPIAPAAAAAFARLAEGDRAGYDALMDPCVPLSRTIFEAPTQYYKAGVVFLAWLNGLQDHFTLLGGLQASRGALHYAKVFREADAAGLLEQPERAASRMRALMATYGIA